VQLASVSCAATTSCVVVGSYLDSSTNTQGLLLNDASGAWSATEAPLPPGAATNPGALQYWVSCATSGPCVVAGGYIDSNGGQDALLEIQDLVLAPVTASWSTTLGGYDASVPEAVTVDVDSFGSAGWDLAVQASGLPASGSHQLTSPTVNGSSSSAGSASSPSQSCVGACTTASGDTVTYPLSIPVAAPADLYNAAAGSGTGEIALATYWWIAVPAKTYAASAYSATVTLTLSNGP
jgi:hypothetical protein